MSRVGKAPITIPANTQVKIDADFIIVKGPKGELRLKTNPEVQVAVDGQEIKVSVTEPDVRRVRALWGLFRNLINNMVIGVNSGFEKKLEIKGVGYRVQAAGRKIVLNLGYSHPIDFPLPEGINAAAEGNFITISGADKQLVGEIAAQIRKLRPPEPYKGKGIKYVDEVIRRKAGKTAASK